MGYEWQTFSHIYCSKSLFYVSVPFLVTGCWLSPLGCTIQYFSIQEVHKYCWCVLLLYFSGHVDIFHQEYLWCLIDNFHWLKCCKLAGFWEGTIFSQYFLHMQQPGWYLLISLCWYWFYWDRTLLGTYLWWVPYARLLVMRSLITWYQEMGYHPIIWRWWSSWDCMMHPWHSPVFLFSPPSGSLFPHFPCFVFMYDSTSSLRLVFLSFTVFLLVQFFSTIIAGGVV